MTDTPTDASAPTTKTTTVKADGVTTAEIDGEERDVLRVPISSTRSDREHDRFARDALEDMAEQIRSEQPHVFDNHGLAGDFMSAIPYDSRETIGTQFDAEVEEAEDGEAELYALVNPDGTHPEGERMLKQVRDEKQAIKFSVGFGILGYDDRAEVEEDFEGDGRVFTAADLMETSRVGIPANPDASLATAEAKAAEGLPGYTQHPMYQMLMEMRGEREVTAEGVVAKDAVDSDTVQDATPVQVDGQGEVTERDGDPEGKPKCDDDADCPDGEECIDGHCQEPSDADTETDSDMTGQSKAPGDIGPADFNEFVASHYDGLDAADVTDALDEMGGDYVGEVDVPELASFTADVVDQDTGTVQDQFDEWMGGDDMDDEEEGDAGDESAEGETESADADKAAGMDDLRERIDQLEAELADGSAESKTADPSTEPENPDLGESTDTDDADDTDDDTKHETIFD